MDGFTYYNIFETKGIEYLAVIAFFLVLIPFWIILNRHKTVPQKVKNPGIVTAEILRIPQGLFFSRNHTWTNLERSGLAKVGLDDLLLHITGEVRFDRLRQPGEKVFKGDLIAEIDHNGKRLKVFSPVSGEVTEINPALTGSPEILNGDPYSKGWMYRIKPSDWRAETGSYYLAGEASEWIINELARFRDFLAASIPGHLGDSRIAFQDGGELVDHTLSNLPEEVWKEFQQKFMNY